MKIMTCDKVREIMSYYLDKTLQLDEMEAMGHHLLNCRECRAEAEQLEEIIGLLHRVPQTPVPDRFELEWKRAIKKEILEPKSKGRGRGKPPWKAMSGIAAVLVVGVLSLAMMQDGLRSGVQDMAGYSVVTDAGENGNMAHTERGGDASTPDALMLQTPDDSTKGDSESSSLSGNQDNSGRVVAKEAGTPSYGSVYGSGEGQYKTTTYKGTNSKPSTLSDRNGAAGGQIESADSTSQNGEDKKTAVILDGDLSRGSSYFSSEDEYNEACADWMSQYLEAINTNDSALFSDIIAKAGINGYTTDMVSTVLKLYGDYLGYGTITSRPLRSNPSKMENSYIIEGPLHNFQLSMKTTASGIQVTETLLNYGPWLSDQMSDTPYVLSDYQVQKGGAEIVFKVELTNSQPDNTSDTSNSDEKQVKEIVWKKTE